MAGGEDRFGVPKGIRRMNIAFDHFIVHQAIDHVGSRDPRRLGDRNLNVRKGKTDSHTNKLILPGRQMQHIAVIHVIAFGSQLI
jgi:hypothetical protein